MGASARPGDDDFDERTALEEIDLYTEVLIAAGSASGTLSLDELDRVLGIRRPGETG